MRKVQHPGIILQNDFLKKTGVSKSELAMAIFVPSNRILEITRMRRGISADTDLRLSRYFGTKDGYWLELQNAYDLEKVRNKNMKTVGRIIPKSR